MSIDSIKKGRGRDFYLFLNKIGKKVGIGMIMFYQRFISPCFPASCRFYPTCSEYCRQALKKYGLIKGGWLGAKRILKCHPFCAGGYDPMN